MVAITLLCLCAVARADTALWVATSPTATVYLFGTVHVLPDGFQWRDPALDKALAASAELYVEEDDSSPSRMHSLALQYGLNTTVPQLGTLDFTDDSPYSPQILPYPSYTLSEQLDAGDRARIEIFARGTGIPDELAVLNKMRPWLAAVTIANTPIARAGYAWKFGADSQLERTFKLHGKPIGAFETASEQMRFLADLPFPVQLALLRRTIEEYNHGSVRIGALVRTWRQGDMAAIAALVDRPMREHYPDLYRVLLVDRNHKWAGRIARLLRQHRTVFVAVGVAHFAGPDSLPVQLRKLGIQTTRVH